MKFLTSLRDRLATHPPVLNNSKKKASVAAIFRVCPTAETDKLQLLFIKRAVGLHDKWSGHIALPGGRQQPQESLFETAVRETREEVGFDLMEKPETEYLGQLDDQEAARHLNVSTFVFLYHAQDSDDPHLKLQTSEVNDAIWIDHEYFKTRCEFECLDITLEQLLPRTFHDPNNTQSFFHQLGKFQLQFAALHLPKPAVNSSSSPLPSKRRHVHDYVLWGLTLRIVAQLYSAGGHPELKNMLSSINLYTPAKLVHYAAVRADWKKILIAGVSSGIFIGFISAL